MIKLSLRRCKFLFFSFSWVKICHTKLSTDDMIWWKPEFTIAVDMRCNCPADAYGSVVCLFLEKQGTLWGACFSSCLLTFLFPIISDLNHRWFIICYAFLQLSISLLADFIKLWLMIFTVFFFLNVLPSFCTFLFYLMHMDSIKFQSFSLSPLFSTQLIFWKIWNLIV